MASVFLQAMDLYNKLDNVSVIDLRRFPDFKHGHIPRAVSAPFHYFNTLRGLALYPPVDGDLERLAAKLGKFLEPVVLYDEGGCKNACRAAYTLELLGIDALVLLGGFEAWTRFQLPVEVGGGCPTNPTPKALKYVKKPINKHMLTDFLEDGGLVVDTRHPEQYRLSRIPSSVNVPWNLFISEDGVLNLGPDTLSVVEKFLGGNRVCKVVTYCDEGTTSSLVMYVLRMAGMDAECYLPSFSEWGADPGLPKERG